MAERLESLVTLGILNSRMKDHFDIWTLSRQFDFDGETLCDAIGKTFSNRGTTLVPFPPTPSPAGRGRGKKRGWGPLIPGLAPWATICRPYRGWPDLHDEFPQPVKPRPSDRLQA